MNQSYHEQIRETFRTVGPLSTRALALLCIAGGVFPDSWLESASVRAAQDQCRRALKDCGIDGMPFAGKTSDEDGEGKPVWKQREFWDYETYVVNIVQSVDQRDSNHHHATLLHRECYEKFGKAPPVTGLTGSGGLEGWTA